MGTRTCHDGSWGPCSGKVVNATSLAFEGERAKLSLSAPALCATNPCDPTCHSYFEEPEQGLEAEPILTDTDETVDFQWPSGSWLDPQPGTSGSMCFTGEQCAPGQTCRNVATAPGCEHDKCSVGPALTASCDPCVADVCRVHAACCRGPCRPGEVLGPGGDRCYFTDSDRLLAWGAASRACQARGAAWGLVTVDSDVENEFVGELSDAEIWVGLNDQGNLGTWSWNSGQPVTDLHGLPDPALDSGGSCVVAHADLDVPEWSSEPCAERHAFICEGPGNSPIGCAHEPCAEGEPLDSACDPCVEQICAERPSCCTDSWDSECVSRIAAVCGQRCECSPGATEYAGRCYVFSQDDMSRPMARGACQALGSGWDLAVVLSSEQEVWVAGQLSKPAWIGLDDVAVEGNLKWVDGGALSAGLPSQGWLGNSNADTNDCVIAQPDDGWEVQDCSIEASAVCEGPRGMVRQWDASCVGLVETLCSTTCDIGASAPSARCEGGWPGEVDPACAGYDLSLGIPCEGTLPVCNRGNAEAPAGIPVVHFSPGSVDTTTCSPASGAGTTCTTTEAIPPGRCVAITDCEGLDTARQVMVNPPGAGHVDECSCLDNWGTYDPEVTCQSTPSCYGASSGRPADPTRSHVFFLVERSPAMARDSRRGWRQAQSALRAFVRSPDAAGVSVALEFFPLDSYGKNRDGCYSDSQCAEAVYDCGNPRVLPGVLVEASATDDLQEAAVLDALSDTYPGAAAPTSAALEAALTAMRDMSLGQPDDTYAVVLVGTGVPGACEMNTDYLVSLAEYFFKEWGVRTHTVATSNADMTVMDAVARAGGTGAALGLSGWDNSEEGRALLATLVGGTRQPAACTVALANLKNIDPQQATVRYLGEGIEETLERVRSPEACGIDTDGWAFDDETSPTSVELCPHTCERATQDTSSEIRVELGCLGAPVPVLQRTTVRETYEGDCPRTSQQPQWGFVSYSASTPSDSGITLEVRAAPNLDGLEQVPWLPLGHVSAAEENEECYFADGCYLDLWDAVGGVPTVHHPYLEVRITLDPSADNQTPVLDSWEVTYSCPDGE